MRFIEILLEYKRDITKQKLGDRLVAAAQKDRTQDIDIILTSLEAMDPTPNKQYMVWLANQYIQGQFRLEDIAKVKDALEKFTQAKSRLPEKDIGRYTFHSLEDQMDKIFNVELKPQQSADTSTFEVPKSVKVLYNGPLGLLAIPKTEKASCELGSGTKWCTAARDDNMFAEYNEEAPLYIWRDKNGEKYQFHFGDDEQQFMDARDRPIKKELLNQFRTQHPVLKQLFKKEESKIARDPYFAYWYAKSAIRGRFPKAEKAIAQNPLRAYQYAKDIIRGRWPEAEEVIARNKEWAYYYAKEVIKKRWPEAEKSIAQNPKRAFEYARYVIRGRFPEAEKVIAQYSDVAFEYARDVIKGRWPAAEKVIVRYPGSAYDYARYVIKGRWPEAEETIARDPKLAYKYARYVIRGRFPEGEKAIKTSRDILDDYKKFLRKKGITDFLPPKKKTKKKATRR